MEVKIFAESKEQDVFLYIQKPPRNVESKMCFCTYKNYLAKLTLSTNNLRKEKVLKSSQVGFKYRISNNISVIFDTLYLIRYMIYLI